jgi:NADH-quinone oxidoreductase subunit L
MQPLVPLIIAFPVLGLLINIVAGKKIGDPWAGIIASLASGSAFVIAMLQFVGLAATERNLRQPLFEQRQ